MTVARNSDPTKPLDQLQVTAVEPSRAIVRRLERHIVEEGYSNMRMLPDASPAYFIFKRTFYHTSLNSMLLAQAASKFSFMCSIKSFCR